MKVKFQSKKSKKLQKQRVAKTLEAMSNATIICGCVSAAIELIDALISSGKKKEDK